MSNNQDLQGIRDRAKALAHDISVASLGNQPVIDFDALLADATGIAADLTTAFQRRDAAAEITTSDDEQMVRFLDGIIGAVEATSYEKHCLWLHYAEDAAKFGGMDGTKRLSWVQHNSGMSEIIGHFGDMPVNVSLFTATVDGHKILFYEVVSMVAHSDMVRQWLDKTLPASARQDDGRINHTDSQNFHNIFHYVRHREAA